MREHSTPTLVERITTGGLTDPVRENAASHPDEIVMVKRVSQGGSGGSGGTSSTAWVNVTAQQFLDEIRALAKGIMASGVEAGQRIGLMSRTRYEWTLADYAIWYAGAVTVPIYETSSAEQVQWILSDSNAVATFLESDRHQRVFADVAADLPDVSRVWVFDDDGVASLMALGASISDDDLEARRATVGPDSISTIIYTSGTTGRPKGCVLTHASFMFECDNIVAGLPELFAAPGSSTLLFLPLAHVFGRAIQIGCVRTRTTLAFAPDVTNLLADLAAFRPTFLLSVPRVFEKVYNGAQQKAVADGKGTIFDTAARTAIDYSRALDSGGPGLLLRLKHALFDRLVYGKLRAAMGGRVQWAVSGGAPLGERLGHFFRGIGVTILEGYGLTETSAASNVNRPSALRIGTVGQPIPGSTIRIADDGEVLIRGHFMFREYWHNDDATAAAVDSDGWFHSGDIGELDADGYLRITGRKKELIVTSGGKNVAPAVLEDRLRSHWLVSQCMVVGDNRPYIACLLTLDPESLPAWLRQAGKSESLTAADLVDDADLLAELQSAVDDANRAVSRAEAIRRFAVLPVDWTEGNGMLTPSMKLRRGEVMKAFESDVAALYD